MPSPEHVKERIEAAIPDARVEVTDPLASAEPSLLANAGFETQGALLSRAIG